MRVGGDKSQPVAPSNGTASRMGAAGKRRSPSRFNFSRRFQVARRGVWKLLPGFLRSVIPETAVGFAMLNLCTFALDLIVLSVVYRGFGLPLTTGLTLGYLVAFTAAFFLNRNANFESHGFMGRQIPKYILVVAINVLAFINGLSWVLTEFYQWNYLVARVTAGLCEAVFMYFALRWFVFASTPWGRLRRIRRQQRKNRTVM